MQDNIIYTNNLSFYFGKFQALKKISLEVSRNSIYGFLGPNGAGKTTMIKALLGLLKTKSNSVHIFGKELTQHKLTILSRIGAMVETPSLYPALSGFENVEIIRILRNLHRTETKRVIETVGLTSDAYRLVNQYSTGMKQRLALAIAMLDKPELLILDEPMNGLDPAGIIEIREFLLQLNRQYGITILLSSHILSEIEKLATHIGIIDHGSLKFQGTFNELQHKVMGNRKVHFKTGNNNHALDILRAKGKVIEAQQHGFYLFVADHHEIAEAISVLAGNNIDVYEAVPELNDLEDLFINIIKSQD